MAFTFAAFCYIVALILSAFLIFFVIYHVSQLKSHKHQLLNKLYVLFGHIIARPIKIPFLMTGYN